MGKMKITIGLGKIGEGDDKGMDDYEAGYYDAKDEMVAAIAMHPAKGDGKTVRDQILKMIESMECPSEDEGPKSRPSGAGTMGEDDGEEY